MRMRRLQRDMLRFSPILVAAVIMFMAACTKQYEQIDVSQYVTTDQLKARDQGLVILFQKVKALEDRIAGLEK